MISLSSRESVGSFTRMCDDAIPEPGTILTREFSDGQWLAVRVGQAVDVEKG